MSKGNIALSSTGLFLAGILAGEEFVVRYGVQPTLMMLEDRAHLHARQALVRRLRVLVPTIMVPTVIAGGATLVFGGPGPGVVFRGGGTAALAAFVLSTFLGTVPINEQVNDWDAENPPSDWQAVIRRWERIDVLRSSAAILAFACYLTALAQQVAAD